MRTHIVSGLTSCLARPQAAVFPPVFFPVLMSSCPDRSGGGIPLPEQSAHHHNLGFFSMRPLNFARTHRSPPSCIFSKEFLFLISLTFVALVATTLAHLFAWAQKSEGGGVYRFASGPNLLERGREGVKHFVCVPQASSPRP